MPPRLRLAELMASLSLAMDLGYGQPVEWVMRSCLLGAHLGELLGLSEQDRRDAYYLALLRQAGCTACATGNAQTYGDELKVTGAFITDPTDVAETLHFLAGEIGNDQPLPRRSRLVAQALAAGPARKNSNDTMHCEVAAHLATALPFDGTIRGAAWQIFERWDGRGVPRQLKGEAITLPIRVMQVAQDMVSIYQALGPEAALLAARKRANHMYDPAITSVFGRHAGDLFGCLTVPSMWEAVLAAEPGAPTYLTEAEIDVACEAVADFGDLKSPYLVEHSRRVARLAARAAELAGWPEAEVVTVRRAALLHDVGRVGVTAAIWNKPGALSEGEWERVRLHPLFTERIFARAPRLKPLGALAALHHERLDGSGYHRQLPAQLLPPDARLLAAADAYCAMTERRPQREALAPEQAAAELRRGVMAGQFEGEAVQAVLAGAGQRVAHLIRPKAADLTDREREVLGLIAHGFSNKHVASQLSISPRTVAHHIEHIYGKIGASTRAGATLFALQNDLLGG